MYEKGTGRYQKAYDRLSALAPWYGYTGKRWMDAFICLRRLYQGFCKGYLGECFQSEVERYLHPLFPAVNYPRLKSQASGNHLDNCKATVQVNPIYFPV